jgi:hypothetical protein
MPRIAVVVPALQVLPVLDGLLTLYEVRTDLVASRVRDCIENKTPAPLPQRERASLAAIEDAIDQLGWTRVPRDEPATLTAEREIVATAVHAALLSSAEQIVRRCHEYELPESEISPITDALAQTIETHHLLYSISDAPAVPTEGVSQP